MRYISTLLFVIISCVGSAQFRPIEHSDYDHWNRISSYSLTNEGDWLAVETSPQQGDSYTELIRTRSGRSIRFERASSPAFTADGKWLFFKVSPPYSEVRQLKLKDTPGDEMPNNHLVRYNIRRRQMDTIHDVVNFSVHENDGAFVIITLEDEPEEEEAETDSTKTEEDGFYPDSDSESKGNGYFSEDAKRVIVWDLARNRKDTLERVTQTYWAEDVARAILIQSAGDSSQPAALTKWSGYHRLSVLDTAFENVTQVNVHREGTKVAWMRTDDSAEADIHYYDLYLADGENSRRILASQSDDIEEGWMISPNGSVRFNEDATALYLSTTPVPFVPEEDTTILDEEKVHLDIWAWTDEDIQPMQKINADADRDRSYEARLDLVSLQFVQLEDEELEHISIDAEETNRYAVGYQVPHRERASLSWNYPTPRDFYVIDVTTGERKVIASGVRSWPSVSPDEKYAYWWDGHARVWRGYRISDGQSLVLSANIPNPVYDEEHDTPDEPGSYGYAGWTKDDEHFVLYDAYDIWRVKPGEAEAVNLTAGRGRSSETRYRYNRIDREEEFLPQEDWILYAFDEKDKSTAYAEFQPEDGELEVLIGGDFSLSSLIRADSSDVYLFRRETIRDYPEIYVIKGDDLADARRMTNTNPQQKDFRWGTSELVEWTTPTGRSLEGLLLKPEDFDPTGKYPVLVYFYEKYSDQLHNYWVPSPSASVINFPYFLSHEYIIFIPDIVYEEGYPGRSAEECIISGAEMLASQPWADASRMAIQGQSWGGYQVAHLVTRTDMFRCAMAGAPVSNMTSAYGGIRWGSGMSREFQYERTQSRIGGTLWERTDLYLENSPVFYADQVSTPLLIMHNDNDGAVPWYQGIEYFMALRRLSKPVWMLVYNGEEHNLMKRHNRMDLSLRMGQFFDHYLKDQPAPEWLIKGRPYLEKDYNPATLNNQQRENQ